MVWECLKSLGKITQTGLGDWHVDSYGDGHFVLSTPLLGSTLKMRFDECWSRGLTGIPAKELLDYLRPIAQTLDELREVYQMQHLALNPHSILLQRGEVQLSGFGLAALLSGRGGRGHASNNLYYAAPEQYVGAISDTTDVFSLALIYFAMRTGKHPWSNWKTDEHGNERPTAFDWRGIDGSERTVLKRGLALAPRKRFATCMELIDALADRDSAAPPATAKQAPLPPLPPLLVDTTITPFLSTLGDWVAEMVHLANKDKTLYTSGSVHLRLDPGRELVHCLGFRLTWSELCERLERFCQDQQVKMPARNDLSLEMFVPLGNARRGRSAGLKLGIENLPDDEHASEVRVRLIPAGCWNRENAAELLHYEGPPLIHRLRQYLLEKPEQRQYPRHSWRERLVVHPVLSWAQLGAPVVAQCQDISQGGLRLILSADLPGDLFYLNCPEQRLLKAYAGLARAVRRTRLPNGQTEIGAAFQWN
jgi:hypothetical protein